MSTLHPDPGMSVLAPPSSLPTSYDPLPDLDHDTENEADTHMPSPSGVNGAAQTKDSPLTDIGTSPPAFEINLLTEKRLQSKDSYESSELSDLGDDESEAETDKMDFLNDDSSLAPGDKVSDLHRLSELTQLAHLQELDSDDSDDEFVRKIKSSSASSANEIEASEFFADAEVAGSTKRLREEEISGLPLQTEKKLKLEADKIEDLSMGLASSTDTSTIDGQVQAPTSEVKVSLAAVSDAVKKFNEVPELDNIEEVTKVEEPAEVAANDSFTGESKVESESEDVESKQDSPNSPNDVNVSIEEEDEAENGAEEGEIEEDPEKSPVEKDEEDEAAEDALELDFDMDEQRKSAVEELILIEEDFSVLRDKLYKDKLEFLEHELELCLDGSHPELLQIYYKVNEFYQDNIRMANATLNYSLKCINNETIATRTSIHQDFLKNLADTRNEMITNTTSHWYRINKEWNYLDLVVADYNFSALPSMSTESSSMPVVAGGSSLEYYLGNQAASKKLQKQNLIVELVHQRNCLNAQLGVLNGLKEFHGIPSAVANSLLDDEPLPAEELLLRKATPDEVREDLQAMGIFS